jgi:hypothetical protein
MHRQWACDEAAAPFDSSPLSGDVLRLRPGQAAAAHQANGMPLVAVVCALRRLITKGAPELTLSQLDLILIAHSDHFINDPISPEKLRSLGEQLRLGPGHEILDLASGSSGPGDSPGRGLRLPVYVRRLVADLYPGRA